MIAQVAPKALQDAACAPEALAGAAQSALDSQRVRGQIVAVGERRFEPSEQRRGIGAARCMAADFDEASATHLVRDELGAVGGDPDEAAPGLTFALGEIV